MELANLSSSPGRFHCPCGSKMARASLSPGSEAEVAIDTSLTSLSWLLNLRVLDLVTPDVSESIAISPTSEDEIFSSKFSHDKEHDSPVGVSLSPVKKCLIQCAEFSSAPRKYRTDSSKPPFSYTTLIYLAIKHNRTGRVTFGEVLKWIRVNFKFYRLNGPTWENSIRHNLSLNDLFVKLPQTNGGGAYWRINPDYSQTLREVSTTLLAESCLSRGANSRKRALSTSHKVNRAAKMRKRRIKSESACPADPCGLPGDLDWVSLLSSQRLGCASCPSQSCRPSFGSPVLGTPDLGHIGEPVVCSPLIASLTTEVAEIPSSPAVGVNNGALLEEAVLKQDSPPMALLPWDDSQSQSPKESHPWAESKEKTLHELRNLSKKPVAATFAKTSMWSSPESSWSSSSTYSTASNPTPLLSEARIY